jgi:hypothetical protein
MKVLFHLDFKYNRYLALKIYRDIYYKVKRFCEFSDKRLEKSMEWSWKNGNSFNVTIPNNVKKNHKE